MRLGTAIEHLVDNYKYASDKEWIQDKVAWALYYTWKEADDRKAEPQTEADWKDKMWAEAVQADCTTCDQVGRCERGRAVDCPLTNQQTERSE